jgi:hypothetical protein
MALAASAGGGLALLWTRDVVVKLESYDKLHIDVTVHQSSAPEKAWRFTGFYGEARREVGICSNSLTRVAIFHGCAWVTSMKFCMRVNKLVVKGVQKVRWKVFGRRWNIVVSQTWVISGFRTRGTTGNQTTLMLNVAWTEVWQTLSF